MSAQVAPNGERSCTHANRHRPRRKLALVGHPFLGGQGRRSGPFQRLVGGGASECASVQCLSAQCLYFFILYFVFFPPAAVGPSSPTSRLRLWFARSHTCRIWKPSDAMNIKVVDKGTGDTGREMGNQGKPITNRGHGSCNRCVNEQAEDKARRLGGLVHARDLRLCSFPWDAPTLCNTTDGSHNCTVSPHKEIPRVQTHPAYQDHLIFCLYRCRLDMENDQVRPGRTVTNAS